jgi:hypothetical protein
MWLKVVTGAQKISFYCDTKWLRPSPTEGLRQWLWWPLTVGSPRSDGGDVARPGLIRPARRQSFNELRGGGGCHSGPAPPEASFGPCRKPLAPCPRVDCRDLTPFALSFGLSQVDRPCALNDFVQNGQTPLIRLARWTLALIHKSLVLRLISGAHASCQTSADVRICRLCYLRNRASG